MFGQPPRRGVSGRRPTLPDETPLDDSITTQESPGAGAARPADRTEGRGSGASHPLLGLSLFWKIFLANLALAAVSAAAGAWLTASIPQGNSGALMVTAILVASTVILVSLAVNAGLVRYALSPLASLHQAALRIRSGDADARAEELPTADESLREVIRVFNDMLEVLSVSRERQQELARRVLESEERERQLIAHELYSGTAQTLAGVLVRLRIAERHQAGGTPGSIEEIREQVVEALEEVRGVARRLRPPELDELGVRVALEAHARSMTEGRRPEVRFSGELPELSREVSLALFRIVQEAISNAALHAGADTLDVRFHFDEDYVSAEVEDDGVGFDLGAALGQAGGSLGLFGMHERAGYVNGELSIESGPGLGTKVRVVIPRGVRIVPDVFPAGHVEATLERLRDGLAAPAAAGHD